MSFVNVGSKEKDIVSTDARSRQIDDNVAIANSAAVIRNYKDVEIRNVCGSTAGAGSGTFHKYRQCKRREQFRLQQMKQEAIEAQRKEKALTKHVETQKNLEFKAKRRRKNRDRAKNRKKKLKVEQEQFYDMIENNNDQDSNDKDKGKDDGNSVKKEEQLDDRNNENEKDKCEQAVFLSKDKSTNDQELPVPINEVVDADSQLNELLALDATLESNVHLQSTSKIDLIDRLE